MFLRVWRLDGGEIVQARVSTNQEFLVSKLSNQYFRLIFVPHGHHLPYRMMGHIIAGCFGGNIYVRVAIVLCRSDVCTRNDKQYRYQQHKPKPVDTITSHPKTRITPNLKQKTDAHYVEQINRPPTLLVHGLCIRVIHRESDRVLRLKQHAGKVSSSNSSGDVNLARHQVTQLIGSHISPKTNMTADPQNIYAVVF